MEILPHLSNKSLKFSQCTCLHPKKKGISIITIFSKAATPAAAAASFFCDDEIKVLA